MAAEEQGSVTHWIDDLKGGEDAATGRLWGRYFDRLARLARERLRAVPRTVADEEDIALSAFDSFFAGVERGRFPRLEDRDDLWGILVTIARRKAADHAERLGRQKRGGGRVLDEAALAGADGQGPGIDEFAGAEPTPEVVAATTEELRRLFGLLPDESLRIIALLKMEGHTNDEIASSRDCALRSVERKLERIRNLWAAGGAIMRPDRPPAMDPLSLSHEGRIDAACDRYEAAWKAGGETEDRSLPGRGARSRTAGPVPSTPGAGAGASRAPGRANRSRRLPDAVSRVHSSGRGGIPWAGGS